jgi:hypothetical protein
MLNPTRARSRIQDKLGAVELGKKLFRGGFHGWAYAVEIIGNSYFLIILGDYHAFPLSLVHLRVIKRHIQFLFSSIFEKKCE